MKKSNWLPVIALVLFYVGYVSLMLYPDSTLALYFMLFGVTSLMLVTLKIMIESITEK